MTQPRSKVPKKDQWNVESLYPNIEEWEIEFTQVFPKKEGPKWPKIDGYRGKLGDKKMLKEALDTLFSYERQLMKLYTYAHLRHDEELTYDDHKAAYTKACTAAHTFQQEVSWIEPELLSLPEDTLKSYLESSELKTYHFYLETLLNLKPHRLNAQGESLLAQSGTALQTATKTFSAINDADLDFPAVQDSKGKSHTLSHAQFGLLLRDRDRKLRQNTFSTYLSSFEKFENTFAELLQGQVQKNLFFAKARNYKSSLESSLQPDNIDRKVYTNLIETIHKGLPSLHKYMKKRKELMGLEKLHLYDLYVPLTKELEITMPYDEAEALIIESVAPLGKEYQDILRKGLQTDRWVDRYENKGKRSGGYSSGCFDSMPFILLNYKEVLRDVFVLAHEAGHSMHSQLSRTHQPSHYADYTIFVAEVASTFNEELLMRHLLEKLTDEESKLFLINQKLEDIRSTLFRQTMFAEFELWIHEQTENHIPLTPKLLNEKYLALNSLYFGDTVTIDPLIAYEWARIPHFYYNFYVYQYATGISAALDLVETVLNGGEKEREAYLTFLKSGGSKYPLDLLKGAGVNMLSPKPIETTIHRFDELLALL